MARTLLTNEQWYKLKIILLQLGIYNKHNLRLTVEGILFRIRTGIPWRDLPVCFGYHNTIYKTFVRWSKLGKLMKLFQCLSEEADAEWVFIDGSYIKAHQHACNVANKTEQGIGKSVGGNTTKIHLVVDACGNPIDFIITGGQVHDVKIAPQLIEQNKQVLSKHTEVLSADKGYDCDDLREQIKQTNTTPNIPKRSNSKSKDQNPIDDYLYKLRHLVENAFEKCKRFRAVATRYDKLLVCYEGTVALAFVCQWVRLL